MPDELAGRRLWNTQRAYIYAADKSVAGETQRWVGELAGHLRRTYDRDLGKGLVIVVDKDERPFVKSIETLVRLQRQAAVEAGAKPDQLPTVERQREILTRSGMSEALVCRVTPAPLDDRALASAGLDDPLPDDIAWRICCPSQRLMEAAVWDFAPKALEKKKGRAFAVMTAWAWPLAFPEAAKAFRLARDGLVFELWAIGQAEWTAEQRAREIARYTRQRAFVISPTLSLALSLAKKDGADAAVQSDASDTTNTDEADRR